MSRSQCIEMRSILTVATTAVALALAAAGPAQARTSSAGGMEARIVSGGVGEGERAQLAERARDHNLKLVFTMTTGSYLAEVPFQIERGGKLIAEDMAQGPWAFVKLPPGSYTVKATYEGRTQSKQVTLPRTGQKSLSFAWPASARVAEQPQGR